MDSVVITVVIPTASAWELLPTAVAHLEVQSYPAARFEVIIADYGQQDASSAVEQYIQGTPMRMRYLRAPGKNYAAAANRAVAKAAGQWLLFLDEELLAGPNLVEQHVTGQERQDGGAALVGRIKLHPRVAPATTTKWGVWPQRESEPASRHSGQPAPAAPVHFLDWRTENLSLPRDRLVDAGGFSEAAAIQGAEDAELAGRLHDGGLPGFTAPTALAYAWRASTLTRERARQYTRGYALHELELMRDHPGLARTQLPSYGPLRRALLGPSSRIVSCMCRLFAGSHETLRRMTRMLLRQARLQGYLDARRGRSPRPPGERSGQQIAPHPPLEL